MQIPLPSKLAQFGNSGFLPPVPDSPYYQNTGTTQGALTSFEYIISTTLGVATILAGLMFILYFVIATLGWVTAGADSGKVQKSRDQITNGVIGLALVVSSYAIIGLVGSIFGLQLLNPAAQLQAVLGDTPVL